MTICVDKEKLLDQGYLIVPQCVPSEKLESLRAHCEQMLERHKKWWADNRKPGQPAGGDWDVLAQPRVLFDRVEDSQACEAIEFVFHENTYGINRQVMETDNVAPTLFCMFCNPRQDHGPADWHRDIRPPAHGPVEAYYTDFLSNPPCSTQWTIALYDDDVLWVVPGSHRRFNTDEENRQLGISEYKPLDTGMPVRLKAGDAVMYMTPILHWGSNYSSKLRRTLQYAYRSFYNGSLTGAHGFNWDTKVIDVLPEHLASRLRFCVELRDREHDDVESIFRAMIAKDEQAFRRGLNALHSGEVGRMSCVVQLSKMAGYVRYVRGPVGSRFTAEEGEKLWQQFEPFDRSLCVDKPYLIPGFQNKEPSPYNFNETSKMDVDAFIASW